MATTKRSQKEEFPRIEVVWADHYSNFEDGFTIAKIKEMLEDICIRKTSGYLVGENRRQLALASTIEDDGTVSEIFICMKKAIISRSDQ